MSDNFLYQDIESFLNTIFMRSNRDIFDKLDDVTGNLNHELRQYQSEALLNLLFMLNFSQYENGDDTNFENQNHFLFRMATGSGKTNILASSILAIFQETGIQRFLFTTNLKSVLDKTRHNLLVPSDSKYLFNKKVIINGQTISIQEVAEDQEFPSPDRNTIYIKIVSIQKLLSLKNKNLARENRTTIDNLVEEDLTIIIDEAHHFNKNATTTIKATNDEDATSFEDTIDYIRDTVKSKGNQVYQLEFTATMPFDTKSGGKKGKKGKALLEKYKNKLIYDYNLTHFVDMDGYGKTLNQIAYTDSVNRNNNRDKMLLGILMSEYRKYVAEKYGFINFKPVILFKSNTVKGSNSFEKDFIKLLEGLEVTDIQELLNSLANVTSETLILMKEYYESQNLTLIVNQLKNGLMYSVLNANNSDVDRTLRNLNTLENPDNPFRVVFAVQKVSEGWDVLNLYDIIRLDENGSRSQTTGEAQLVGRGSRYYPLKHESGHLVTKQTFTDQQFNDKNNNFVQELVAKNNNSVMQKELQLLESLHYHTLQEENYLKELKKAYSLLGIPVLDENETDTFDVSMKSRFMESYVYKYGFFYENQQTKPEAKHYTKLSDYSISNTFEENVTNMISETAVFKDGKINNRDFNKNTINIEKRFILEAMDRITFYRFNTMKKYMPSLHSKREFIESDNWLNGHLKSITLRYPKDEELTESMILAGVIKTMQRIAQQIQKNFMKPVGTKSFKKVYVKDKLPKAYSRQFKKRVDLNYKLVNYKNDTWSAYDYIIGSALEIRLINYMKLNGIFDQLKDKYESVYLIRNDEAKVGLKLHNFGDSKTYMPDFLLYLENGIDSGKNEVVQLYLEPKGEHLYMKDKWKEELLLSLGNDTEIVFEDSDSKFSLLGVKFFIGNERGEPISYYLDKFNLDFEDKTGISIYGNSDKHQTNLFNDG